MRAGNATEEVKSTKKPSSQRKNTNLKLGLSKCFRCFQPRHRSNECPDRKKIQLVEGESDSKVEITRHSPLAEDFGDLFADVREMISCVMEKVFVGSQTLVHVPTTCHF